MTIAVMKNGVAKRKPEKKKKKIRLSFIVDTRASRLDYVRRQSCAKGKNSGVKNGFLFAIA